MHLYTSDNGMFDFIYMAPVDLSRARRKRTMQNEKVLLLNFLQIKAKGNKSATLKTLPSQNDFVVSRSSN